MEFICSKLKLYLDTTIPSYLFALDSPERMEVTRRFMRLGHQQDSEMIISDVVMREVMATPEPKRSMMLEQIAALPVVPLTEEANVLARAYIEAGILPRSAIEDARHVAIATLNRVDALVSWNFGHLVNIRRSKGIGVLNEQKGLPHIEIITPEEVVKP